MSPSSSRTEKRWIRPLPERVINKIAAGEVIERPAAVVKELVENAIDAGADRIDIIVDKSGANLIKIVDNGCCISEDQVEIAFSRHATSKIRSFDDLSALNSYGFRGEALPSVASVCRLRMVTRAHDTQVGTEIIYEGGVLQSKRPIAASPGTVIEVENLFYNTPARRKFLKAETTEARHISRTAMALAIGRADIGFSFSLNKREIFSLPPDSSLRDRVAGVFGGGKKFVEVKGENGPVSVAGFIGTPDTVQQNRYGQFLFINSRYIQSATLSHAWNAGYGELIPRGSFPIGALLLTVDPTEVDVNVHPTKAEVRLSRERDIHESVYRVVKEALRGDGIIPSFRAPDEPDTRTEPARFTSQFGDSPRRSPYIPGIYNKDNADPNMLAQLFAGSSGETSSTLDMISVDRSTGEVIETNPVVTPASSVSQPTIAESFRLVGRFSDLYLLLQSGDDLYIVDQHTAHERVLYEETMHRVETNSMHGQMLLLPVQLELDPEQLAVFDEVAATMNASGFTVSHFWRADGEYRSGAVDPGQEAG